MDGAAQVPWDRIISAAAASTLGIVSLALLVVAIVAVMLFKESGDRTRLIVFGAVVAMALVGLAIAVLRERGDAAPVVAGSPAEPASNRIAAGPQEAEPVEDVASGGAAEAEVGANNGAGADPTGRWEDDDGFVYDVTVSHGHFAYTQLLDGEAVGSGVGTIEGRQLRYHYTDERTLDRGECRGLLSVDGSVIDGTCGNGENEWGFKIQRS